MHVKLNAIQVVSIAADHPNTITESNIKIGEMLGITESDTKYRKRENPVRYIDTANQHLTDAIPATLGDKDEVPVTS